jgi:hypothetical protein
MSGIVVRQRKALEPVASVVTFAFRLSVIFAGLRVILALIGVGPNFGWGGNNVGGVCMNVDQGLLQHTNPVLSTAGMAAGVDGTWTVGHVCAAHATVVESLVAALTQLPTALLYLGAFYLAQRLIRVAVRDGIYTSRVTQLMRLLGWWLLAGELAARLIEAFAQIGLLSLMVTWRVDWGQWFVGFNVSWPVILIGLGLLTFARITRLGVSMREDLEGTV